MYRVILEFKNASAFELTVEAKSKAEAKLLAESRAKFCGWSEPVKKAIIIEV